MSVQLNGIWARTYRILRVRASSIHQQRCPVHVHTRAISPRSLGTRDSLNHAISNMAVTHHHFSWHPISVACPLVRYMTSMPEANTIQQYMLYPCPSSHSWMLTKWSYFQGCILTTAFQKYSRSSKVRAIGECTAGTPVWPGTLVAFPVPGKRPTDALIE